MHQDMSPKASLAPPQVTPGTWVDQHGDVLFRYALARVQDRAVAEDLVQDTLLAAIQGFDRFAHGSTVRTWLIGILRHKILDYIRQRSRDRRVWHVDVGSGDEGSFDAQGNWAASVAEWGSPEASLQQDQFWAAFEHCLEELPENLRTTFALREFDGLDTEALATLFGTTKNNTWVMLSRARKSLRDCLQARWFEA